MENLVVQFQVAVMELISNALVAILDCYIYRAYHVSNRQLKPMQRKAVIAFAILVASSLMIVVMIIF